MSTSLLPRLEELLGLSLPEFPVRDTTSLNARVGYSADRGEVVRLSLANLHLSELPDLIQSFPHLGELWLANNDLTVLPDWVCSFPLLCLDLSNNSLTHLPGCFGQLHHLRILWLHNNSLAQPDCFPADFWTLPSLANLDLSQNGLSELPKTVAGLKQLKILDLSNNLLSTLPPEVGQLPSLRTLLLPSNMIRSLPPSLANCPSLIDIDLSESVFDALPDGIECLSDLDIYLGGLSSDLLWLEEVSSLEETNHLCFHSQTFREYINTRPFS